MKMESRLRRSRIMQHQFKDNLLSPTTSHSHTSPSLEFYDSRQQLLQDSGLPVADVIMGQDVAKKLQQESRERGDSKIPIYVKLAKSSLSASTEYGGQRIPSSEQCIQDRKNSAEIESGTQSKPDLSDSERSARGTAGHCLPVETLIAAKEKNDEMETRQTENGLGRNEMFAVSRVRDLRHKFEAATDEQSKRKLEIQQLRKDELQSSLSKGQQTSDRSQTLDIREDNEQLTNEITDSALNKRDFNAFPSQQRSISNHPPYRRWISVFPRSTTSLSTQRPSIVNKTNESLFGRGERLEHQRGQSGVSTHDKYYGRLVVVQETTDEQPPGDNGNTSADEQLLGNQDQETKIDSESEKSCDCSMSLLEKNINREEEAEPNSNRTRLASKRLGPQPKETCGFLNPVGRVHSEPLTRSSLTKTTRAALRQSPLRRRIFETKSDKTVSHTAKSRHIDEEEEEDRDRDRVWCKKSDRTNERRSAGHRSLTDHRAEGNKLTARNKYVSRVTPTSDDSIESHTQPQQNDELVDCLRAANSIQHDDDDHDDHDDHGRENPQPSIAAEDNNEQVQLLSKAQIDNTDEQKQLDASETRSVVTSLCRIQRPIDGDGNALSRPPLPSSIARGIEDGVETLQPPPPALALNGDHSVATIDRYRLRSDWSPNMNRSPRPSTFSSLGDFYIGSSSSSSRPSRVRMRRLATSLSTDYSDGLCSSSIAQPATQKQAQLPVGSESPVDSSYRCVQRRPSPLPLLLPPPPPLSPHSSKTRTKASCELSESNLMETTEEGEVHRARPLVRRRTTSKELWAEQTSQAIESDNGLLQNRQNSSAFSFEDSWRDSATSLATVKHRLPKKTSVLLENDGQIEAMSGQIEAMSGQIEAMSGQIGVMPVKPDAETCKDQMEAKNDAEFVLSSYHPTSTDQNEKFMSCAEFADLPEERGSVAEPLDRTSQMSTKPWNGFISMYRTRGPIRAKFPDRVKTVIDSKTTMAPAGNISPPKRDPCRPQTVSLRIYRPEPPTIDQEKPTDRNASTSRPLTKLCGSERDEYLSRLDDSHHTVVGQRPILKSTKSRQKRPISPFLHESWSTDSATTDCALNAKTLQLHTRRSLEDALSRRQDDSDCDVEAVTATASACRYDIVSSGRSFANARAILRRNRQQLAEEEEAEDDSWSAEELLKNYSHPLWLSDDEPDLCSNGISLFDRKEDDTVQDSRSPVHTMNIQTEKTEEDKTEITRRMLIDQNRLLFDGARILQFRQRVCLVLIGIIVILVFYMKIFPIVHNAIFRENNS